MWAAATDMGQTSGAVLLLLLFLGVLALLLVSWVLVSWSFQVWRRSLRHSPDREKVDFDQDPWSEAGQRLQVDEDEGDQTT